MDLYKDVARKLLDAGHAYHCYCSQEELDSRPRGRPRRRQASGYDGHCRELTAPRSRTTRPRAASRSSASGCPTRRSPSPTWPRRADLHPENVPDYGIVRANGAPLYTLVQPVDGRPDGDHPRPCAARTCSSSTPRQIALYKALTELASPSGPPPSDICRT
ncbi:hypothetical protein GCM10023238_18510 [Streptomyces heliomycini]